MKPTALILLALTLPTFAFDITVAEKDHVAVATDGKVVAKFMMANDLSTPEKHHETYKPYMHVFSADGSTRLTKGAGFSFTHHRGIFLGFSKIAYDGKSYDRWHMKGGDQVVTKVSPGDNAFTAHIDWQGDTATCAYRDYGRFGMFPKGKASAESPFKLRYQWLIAEGDVRDATAFQNSWNAFASKSDPVPAITINASERKAAKPKK